MQWVVLRFIRTEPSDPAQPNDLENGARAHEPLRASGRWVLGSDERGAEEPTASVPAADGSREFGAAGALSAYLRTPPIQTP